MGTDNTMNETFLKLLHQDKSTIVSHFGTPDVSQSAFIAYFKNNLWMVLFFRDEKKNNSFRSALQSVTVFDDSLHLLWSNGICLIENAEDIIKKHPLSIKEFVAQYGTPHAQVGGMVSALQYLTNSGQVMVVRHHQGSITEIRCIELQKMTIAK